VQSHPETQGELNYVLLKSQKEIYILSKDTMLVQAQDEHYYSKRVEYRKIIRENGPEFKTQQRKH
jgi:hypothetical protein